MARTRPPDPTPPAVRLFVALELPRGARGALAEWQAEALRGRDDLRAVAPDALHVTLAFIGHRPAPEVEPIAAAVRAAVGGLEPARLAATGVCGVPRRRPRLFAVDLDDPDAHAGAIAAAVAGALSAAGFYEPEKRRFWPHVTVARLKQAERRAAAITIPPPADEFTASEVVLLRSHLGRGPARYEPLARIALEPAHP